MPLRFQKSYFLFIIIILIWFKIHRKTHAPGRVWVFSQGRNFTGGNSGSFLSEAEQASSLVDENGPQIPHSGSIADHKKGPFPAVSLSLEGRHGRRTGNVEKGHHEERIGGKGCEEGGQSSCQAAYSCAEQGTQCSEDHFLGEKSEEEGYTGLPETEPRRGEEGGDGLSDLSDEAL